MGKLCRGGDIARVLKEYGYNVICSDIIDRGYEDTFYYDMLEEKDLKGNKIEGFKGDIVTNPPYSKALECIENSLKVVNEGNKVAALLKIQFLEGQKRRVFFDKYPPKKVLVFSKRVLCAKNGDFESIKSSAVCYAWYIWERGFKGKPTIDWL